MTSAQPTGLQVEDAGARAAALDAGRSYIVQAPAGSGKTELLIQRYLVLLALAREPEEIAAITFTRKAAAEMRLRVLHALEEARGEPQGGAAKAFAPALAPHARLTRELAHRVLARDAERGWRLAANGMRLRIQTFDALCASLTRQMPVLSAFGAQPRSVEDAERLYREAARATLARLDDEAAHAQDLARLLVHLDNNLAAVETLLADMLARRDHWLPHLANANQRAVLEAALASARHAARRAIAAAIPDDAVNELCEVARYAAGQLAANGTESPIAACADLRALPGHDESAHAAWLGLAALLLTNEGEWRKPGGLNVKLGFPAGVSKAEKEQAKQWKTRHGALTASLTNAPDVADLLHAIRALPAARYTDEQWGMLGTIVRLLPVAVAHLKLAFAARGEADFVEIAQRANLALGEPEAPTDLMLALDYRIHHLLVDEFQDTSFTQFALLEKLVAGWNAGEAHGPGADERVEKTLFLVGDPMQSIYRFRQAEVGLFLRAKHDGLGGVRLTPLTLSANFRSRQGVVDWVNGAFARIMPARDDMTSGAVSYARSSAVHLEPSPPRTVWGEGRVFVHAAGDDPQAEAHEVARIVEQTLADRPSGTIALLVRNRGHLRAIVPALREAGLAFQAIDIEPLGHRQSVRDIYSLTRALEHPADRIAWLAVLRAPWSGLSLADLDCLVGTPVRATTDGASNQQDMFAVIEETRSSPADVNPIKGMETVWASLRSPPEGLSVGARARVQRLVEVLAPLVDTPLRGRLRARVESAWLALGGPACVLDASDLDDVDLYLDTLAAHEEAGVIADPAAFDEAVARLYALPDARADARLQIMTIHKAKGLEFDTVIVPSLHAGKKSDDKRLLAWMESAGDVQDGATGGRGRLLIAPINPAGEADEPTYQYLRQLEKIKARHEETRLLYVAATRAREALHWLGEVRRDADGHPMPPPAESLMARMWPVLEAQFVSRALEANAKHDTAPRMVDQTASAEGAYASGAMPSQILRRLREAWRLPTGSALHWSAPPREDAQREAVEFSWAGETARHIGSVVHRWMQRIAEEGLAAWNTARIDGLREGFHAQLAARGVAEAECGEAANRVAEALIRTLDDPRGQWLLREREGAKSEYRLTSAGTDGRRDWIIDRTFVDEDGVRWIVDFKTSRHDEADVEVFLDREQQRYRAQLEGYAKLLSEMPAGHGQALSMGAATQVIRLGLYFPLLGGWRAWTA